MAKENAGNNDLFVDTGHLRTFVVKCHKFCCQKRVPGLGAGRRVKPILEMLKFGTIYSPHGSTPPLVASGHSFFTFTPFLPHSSDGKGWWECELSKPEARTAGLLNSHSPKGVMVMMTMAMMMITMHDHIDHVEPQVWKNSHAFVDKAKHNIQMISFCKLWAQDFSVACFWQRAALGPM